MSKLKKQVVINMPQMAVEALSENYLFKEVGDCHWEMICSGLNTKSFDLKNDTGERLYATFVRIRIKSEGTLKAFKENQLAEIDGEINRFGDSMYFSKVNFKTKSAAVTGELMTTFSIRDKVDNTSLSKSEPDGVENEVKQLSSFPVFGNDYRLVKKRVQKSIVDGPYEFPIIEDESVYECDYELNPFYDINGVNLLYFAAYPIINDYCESRYFNSILEERWESQYSTAYKDVLYYANCNLYDTLVYRLCSSEKINENSYKNTSTLSRKSDGAIIARIFSIKTKIT